ncbi:MAG: hypothetical protein PHI37_00735 [Candidatus Gracilibacteria bacterium]|nr:hypothetical protein [Candidatus Gracilibacteria bacterium]
MNPTLSENPGKALEITTKKVSEIKDAILSEEQREKYKDVILNMEQVEKLKQGKLTIEELTKLQMEQLRKTMSYSPEKLKSALKQGNEDAIESAKKAEEAFEDATGNLEGNVKAKVEDIKDKAQELKDDFSKEGILLSLEKIEKEGGIIGFLVGILLGIMRIFGYKNQLGEAAEKVEGAIKDLSPEKIKEVKDKIIISIEKSTGITLTPEVREKLSSKIDPNNPKSFLNGNEFNLLAEKLKKGEDINIDDLNKLGLLEKIQKDPEFKIIFDSIIKKTRDVIVKKLSPYIEQSGVKLEGDNLTKFEKILNEEISENRLIELIKKGEGTVLDTAIGAWELATLLPRILFKCYKEDLIEAKNLAISVGEYGTDKIKIGLKALSGEDIIPDISGLISWDEMDNQIENLSPEKKLLLQRVFYSELGLVAGVLGIGTFALSSGIVSVFEMGDKIKGGVNPLKEPGKLFTSPAQRLQNTLNKLNPGSGVWMNDMMKAMKSTEESYRLLDELKQTSTAAEKTRITNRLGQIEQELKILSAKSNIDSPDLYKKGFNSPLQSHYYRNNIKDLEQIVSTNNKLGIAKINGNLGKYVLEAKHIIESFKIKYIGASAVLRVGNEVEAKELIKAFGKLTPEILRGLLGKVPIILTSGALISTFNENKEKSSLWEAFLSTQGFTGGFMLLDEAKININDGLKVENIGAASAGVLVLGTETFLVGKDLIRLLPKHGIVGGIGRAAFNSAFRIPVEMIKLGGWTIARGNDILKVAGSLLKNSPKKGQIGIGLTLVGAGLLLARGAMADDISTKDLEKQGLIDEKGNLKLDGFNNLDDKIKQSILDLTTISFLDKYFKNKESEFSLLYENGIYTIKTTQENFKSNPQVFEDIEHEIGKISNETGFNIKLKFES